jgi:ABC-type antimicrobial peptide transport system permease subunit
MRLFHDLKVAARTAFRARFVSALAVLTFALGIGVTTAVLNDVKPTDVSVFLATAVSVLVVALVASYLPARSAGRVDPMLVLRDA